MIDKKVHTGKTLDTVGGVDVVDCIACGFAHIKPLPSDLELEQFYKKEFYDKERPDYFKNAEEDMEWWMATYDHYYDLIERHTSGRRLLDIGSGPGYFLDAGVKRGWDVIGFEPSSSAADYASKRGLKVVNDVFTGDKAEPYGFFDVAMLSLVLEHVPEPSRIIDEAKKVLSPGGLLVVIVPNDYNPLQQLLKAQYGYKPWWVVPTHHINYFSTSSLPRFLDTCGLRQVELETSYPMELFLLGGRNYVENPELGRACHRERMALELGLFSGNPDLLQKMYTAWAKLGIGREIVLITKKEN